MKTMKTEFERALGRKLTVREQEALYRVEMLGAETVSVLSGLITSVRSAGQDDATFSFLVQILALYGVDFHKEGHSSQARQIAREYGLNHILTEQLRKQKKGSTRGLINLPIPPIYKEE